MWNYILGILIIITLIQLYIWRVKVVTRRRRKAFAQENARHYQRELDELTSKGNLAVSEGQLLWIRSHIALSKASQPIGFSTSWEVPVSLIKKKKIKKKHRTVLGYSDEEYNQEWVKEIGDYLFLGDYTSKPPSKINKKYYGDRDSDLPCEELRGKKVE